MKKILLPTDFSRNSKNAIEYALRLFQYEEAEFILLHAYSIPSVGAGTMVSLDDIIRQEAEKGMKEFLGEVCADNFCAVLEMRTKCILGNPRHVIKSYAESIQADYVVMGTKGASGLKEVLLGSVAASVVENLRCPLAIIPVDSKFEVPKIFALATDEKSISDSSVADPLVNLAVQHNAKLVQFSVIPENKVNEAQRVVESVETPTQFRKADGYLTVTDMNVEHGILEFCEDNKVNVLAVVHHEHDFLDRLIHKSMAKKLAMHCDIPLLVLQG